MTKKGEKIDLILNKIKKVVDPAIKESLDLCVDKKYQDIVKYQILTGGKRLRPALAIISCQMLGGKTRDALYPAAGLEILHNYSLIIDDMIDNSILRRNKPTAWAKFGRSIAQCIAIDYFASVFQAANKSKEAIKISELLAKAIKTLTEGEISDLLFEQRGIESEPYIAQNRYRDINMKNYSEMISKKTAALFRASCEVGGICARANHKQLEALRNYGFNLGLAFQISDDILDILGDEKSFGKKIGKDVEERKGGNIVVYLASQKFSPKEKKEFWRILRKEKISQKDINKVINLIKKTGAEEMAKVFCQKFINKARESLKMLPQNKWNNILKEIVEFVIMRDK